MGVGIYLNGRYQTSFFKKDRPADLLRRISDWFEELGKSDEVWGHFPIECTLTSTHDNKPMLSVYLHPAGENVEFSIPKSGQLLVSNKTSTIGPGYHTALCRLMRRFGEELKIRWNPLGEKDDDSQDETGYFFSNDRAAVEEEMLLHLKTMANYSSEAIDTERYTYSSWHLAIGYDYEDYPGGIHTPLGPRSNEWVRAVKNDRQAGRDIYPWWDEGVTASFFLGRALCDMWTKVRWRPILLDEEYEAWNAVNNDLLRAYQLNASLKYPWREWLELVDILDASEGATGIDRELKELIRKRASEVDKEQPLIGYRRYPVAVMLGDGWTIKIPGELAERWEDGTWSAWDGKRTIWVSFMSVSKNDGTLPPAAELLEAFDLSDDNLIHHHDGTLTGKASLGETEKEEKNLLKLQSCSAVNGKSAMCSIYLEDKQDAEWAINTWKSLKNSGSEEG